MPVRFQNSKFTVSTRDFLSQNARNTSQIVEGKTSTPAPFYLFWFHSFNLSESAAISSPFKSCRMRWCVEVLRGWLCRGVGVVMSVDVLMTLCALVGVFMTALMCVCWFMCWWVLTVLMCRCGDVSVCWWVHSFGWCSCVDVCMCLFMCWGNVFCWCEGDALVGVLVRSGWPMKTGHAHVR